LRRRGKGATIVPDQDAVALFIRDATVYWANAEHENSVADVIKRVADALVSRAIWPPVR